jgi:hypothetical protein
MVWLWIAAPGAALGAVQIMYAVMLNQRSREQSRERLAKQDREHARRVTEEWKTTVRGILGYYPGEE